MEPVEEYFEENFNDNDLISYSFESCRFLARLHIDNYKSNINDSKDKKLFGTDIEIIEQGEIKNSLGKGWSLENLLENDDLGLMNHKKMKYNEFKNEFPEYFI